MIQMKIKTRIISYVLTSCFAVIIMLSAFIYGEMRELIFKTLDSRVADISASVLQLISEEGKSIEDTLKEDEYSDIYISISSDRKIYMTNLAKRYESPNTKSRKFTSGIFRIADKKEDDFRFINKEITLNGEKCKVLTGISLDTVKEEVDEMVRSIILASVVAFAVISILGVLISNTILRPIREIINASGNINSRNMDSRISVPPLKDEIYDLTITLNSLFDRLEKSFKLQKEFIANISHEIKTPLTVMNLITDEELQKALDTDKDTKYPMKMYDNLNRVNKLVKDIINLSYIETNQLLSVEDVDLGELVDDILENFCEMIEEKRIKVKKDFNGAAIIKGEMRLLYSMVLNLMHNAVKYNVYDGAINIYAVDGKDSLEFVIENSCPDNKNIETDKLFERFYRAEKSRSREYGGAGLGLAIVKEIVTKHRGEITALKPDTYSISFSITFMK